jgi:hypothetical protein
MGIRRPALRRGSVLVVSAALALSACGSSSKSKAASSPSAASQSSSSSAAPTPTTASPFTEDQLKSALLAVHDLPTGWSSSPTTSPSKKGVCNKDSVNKLVPPAADTSADFVNGKYEPLLSEQMLSYGSVDLASQALTKFEANERSCTSYKQDGATIEIGELSVPPLGDRSSAFRLNISQSGVTIVGDTQVVQQGPVIIYTAYASYSADTEQLVTFSKQAYTKAVNTLHLT